MFEKVSAMILSSWVFRRRPKKKLSGKHDCTGLVLVGSVPCNMAAVCRAPSIPSSSTLPHPDPIEQLVLLILRISSTSVQKDNELLSDVPDSDSDDDSWTLYSSFVGVLNSFLLALHCRDILRQHNLTLLNVIHWYSSNL